MRNTYVTKTFAFNNPSLAPIKFGKPNRIILHRQGNPGAKAPNSLNWGNNTAAFSIHSYIERDTSYDAVNPEYTAYHVKQWVKASEMGYPTVFSGLVRGDFGAIGIETVDEGTTGAYYLHQETRITLLLRVAAYMRAYPHLTVGTVYEHADFDPWDRPDDLGNALNILDFRDDLSDLLSGKEPWRTVGPIANGYRTTVGKPPTTPPPLTMSDGLSWVEAIRRGSTGIKYEGGEEIHEIRVPKRP